MKKLLLAALAALISLPALAADLAVKTPVATAAASCLTAGSCSGAYLDFGIGMDAALGSTLTSGVNNGSSLNFGAGYQFWQGSIIAGIEINGGYQFGTSGATGTATSTQFVKLGYNFFPSSTTSSASAAPTSAQNPFVNLVPANLLANSTPAIIAGGAYGHGIEKGAAGLEVDTVIAASWSTAFQWYNAPAVKGQSDENVFRILVQKHF